ncbi:topoisomerase DNA-binding C4 zinc finger domain-containing protein [Bacillus sp. ISL-8]|nr:topoisomerase DNA-binding C4 zinc finger domain-containing protein [Bacillus sp. ISL-8]
MNNFLKTNETDIGCNKVKCKDCNGFYMLRSSDYGEFGGCTNFPKCKSKLSKSKFMLSFIKENGINIYKWEKKCWKCGKNTDVYSYYLHHQQLKSSANTTALVFAGIGNLKSVDNYLTNKYPSIQIKYSKTTNSRYTANTCIHCNALQGKNYVVDDPHEIFNDMYIQQCMKKYFVENVSDQLLNIKPEEIDRLEILYIN